MIFVLTACGGEGSATPNPVVARGGNLYQAHCQSCHGGATGGSLRDIPPPHNANGHTWHHSDSEIITTTLHGLDFSVEGQQKMPAFQDKLGADDAAAILAYIKTLWTPQERSYQATVTAHSLQGTSEIATGGDR